MFNSLLSLLGSKYVHQLAVFISCYLSALQ
uniref:Uncharacterized protein n=1 Tax=Siphoviridae sp. ctLqe90 TaxID=2825456 RepID=A0A8S5Q1W7_9CAUD|nr:MAG TPA: hypothetical protein [Siphoviridae sp. ctLqe90]